MTLEHRRNIERHPHEQRKLIAALTVALEAQNEVGCDTDTRQLLLELGLSYLSQSHPEVARVVWAFVRSSEGRVFDAPRSQVEFGQYLGMPFDRGVDYSVDIFILAIKDVERLAVLDAFGLRVNGDGYPSAHGVDGLSGKEIWLTEHLGRSVGIGWVNADGMVDAAVAMAQYAGFVSFKNACLVGMAGGRRKIDKGHVVVATVVHDYDRRKVVKSDSGGGHEVRPTMKEAERRSVKVPGDWWQRVEGLHAHEGMSGWWQEVADEVPDWTQPPIGMPGIDDRGCVPAGWKGRVWVKPLLSGGALVEAEDELEMLLKEYDSEAVGLDMESYGFARWCEAYRLDKWLVIRGISDHCGPEPEGPGGSAIVRPKAWQYPSTYFAARVLRDHLFRTVFFG